MKQRFLLISLAFLLVVGFSACKSSSSDSSDDETPSGSSGANGAVTVAAPTIAVSGTGVARSVTLSTTTSGAAIYYTLDGTTPTASSTAYSSAITVAGHYVSKTITAIAVVSGASSTSTSKTVTITPSAALSLTPTVGTLASGFSNTKDITTDGSYLYVVDSGTQTVERVAISSGTVNTFASGFSRPTGITTDGSYLYLADTIDEKLYKIEISTGKVSTLVSEYGFDRITTDGRYLYAINLSSSEVDKVDASSGSVSKLASISLPFFYGSGGITSDGKTLYYSYRNESTWIYYLLKIDIASGTVTSSTLPNGCNCFFGIATDGTRLYGANGSGIKIVEISSGTVSDLVSSGYSSWGITTDGSSLYFTCDYGDKVYKVQ